MMTWVSFGEQVNYKPRSDESVVLKSIIKPEADLG